MVQLHAGLRLVHIDQQNIPEYDGYYDQVILPSLSAK